MMGTLIKAVLFIGIGGLLFASQLALGDVGSQYQIGPGDKIQIRIYKNPDLDTLTRVSAAGTVRIPLVGEVAVGGLAERDVEQRLAHLLESGGYVNNPQVTVAVEEYESRQASVLGYVNRPGKYVISPRGSTVLDLLAMAGGVHAEGADTAYLTQRGKRGAATTEIDLVPILEQGDQRRNAQVADGDVLYVPPMRLFYVYGAVNRPGKYRLERGTTVMKALSVAGGLYVDNHRAQGSENNIQISRRNADGTSEMMSVSLDDTVQSDDVIRVKEKLF